MHSFSNTRWLQSTVQMRKMFELKRLENIHQKINWKFDSFFKKTFLSTKIFPFRSKTHQLLVSLEKINANHDCAVMTKIQNQYEKAN